MAKLLRIKKLIIPLGKDLFAVIYNVEEINVKVIKADKNDEEYTKVTVT